MLTERSGSLFKNVYTFYSSLQFPFLYKIIFHRDKILSSPFFCSIHQEKLFKSIIYNKFNVKKSQTNGEKSTVENKKYIFFTRNPSILHKIK